jgi:hypothetical protein
MKHNIQIYIRMWPTVKFAHDNITVNEQSGELKIRIPKKE